MNSPRAILYTVCCRFCQGDDGLATKWLDWLATGHIQEVISFGAVAAEVSRIDDTVPHIEIRYRFASRESLDDYLKNHAPRLRAEGLAKFPLEQGLEFSRWTGEVVSDFCCEFESRLRWRWENEGVASRITD